MKTKIHFMSLFPIILMGLLFWTAKFELFAQLKPTELKDFKIIIEKTDNMIILKSQKGSAWKDLSFSLKNYQPQAVDECGMTELNNATYCTDEKHANFLFTISKTEKGIELKGIEGTAWSELKFSLAKNKKQAINQFGMTSLN